MAHSNIARSSEQVQESAQNALKECIENCTKCARSSMQLIPYCLELGGEHASAEHITSLQVCSLICETNAKLMLLDSEFHQDLRKICAEVCRSCERDCKRLGAKDSRMLEFAQIAGQCAESCERMSTH